MLGLIKKDIFVMAKRFQKIQLLIMMIVIVDAHWNGVGIFGCYACINIIWI